MTEVRAIFDDLIGQYKVEQHGTEKRYTDLHLAYDVDEDRQVTLDVLRLPYVADSAFALEFIARAKAISQIRHPNVVQVYDTGRTPDGRPFVVQARVDGTTLMHRIEQLTQRQTPANAVYVLKLMRQLAEAVLLAERFGLSHYDLNPENVRLRNVARPTDESVILLDLFIPYQARDDRQVTGGGDRSVYLSPEQRAGKAIDSRSHVYSMGVMLFCLLAGQEPAGAVGRRAAAARRVTSGPTMLGHVRGGLAQATYELVDRAMRAEANLRYDRVGEFIIALDQAIAAEEAGVHVAAQPQPSAITRALGFVIPALAAAVFLVTSLAWVGNRDGGLPVADAAPFGTVEVSAQVASIPAAADAPTNTPAAALLPALAKSAPTIEPSPTMTSEPTATTMATDSGVVAGAVALVDSVSTPEPSATPTPTPSSTPPPAVPQVRIIVSAANLRRGPGKTFDDIGTLSAGEIVEVIAHSGEPQDSWYLVKTTDGWLGWLWPGLAEPVAPFEPSQVPAAATIPPTPTPPPTPTALPVNPTLPATVAPSDGAGVPPDTEVPPTPQPTSPAAPPTRTPPPLSDGG